MPRRPLFMIAAGGAALLVALVVLLQAIEGDSPEVQLTRVASTNHSPEEPAAPSPTAGNPPSARVGKVGTSAPSAPASRGPSGATPSLAPAADSSQSVDPMSNTENLHFGGTQMREQHAAVEPLVRECVDKAVASGQRPNGKAMLTYVVAKQGDKYVIEDTSYDDEETTLPAGPLLECLHRTAKAMKYIGLPRRSQALVVMRTVNIENGELTEYKHVSFSYLR